MHAVFVGAPNSRSEVRAAKDPGCASRVRWWL